MMDYKPDMQEQKCGVYSQGLCYKVFIW